MLDRKNASSTLAGVPPVKGIVQRRTTLNDFATDRYAAGQDLQPSVEYFWTVDWDLPPGAAVESVVIGFPSLHLTAEVGPPGEVRHGARLPATLLHGVKTSAFRSELTAQGSVVGARLRAGGLAAWLRLDAAKLTDRAIRLSGPSPLRTAHERIDWTADPEQRVADLRAILIRHRRSSHPPADGLETLLTRMESDSSLIRVEQLVELTGWSMRTLQRRFRVQLGVSPKQVLSRFRLQEAALQLEREPDLELAELAVRLGWYDQAHFSRDFRQLLGETPGRYAARARAG